MHRSGRELLRAHPTRPWLVQPVPVDPTGRRGPTPGEARGPKWRRVAPRWVVHASVDGAAAEQRILEAARRLPPGSALTGWAALRWSGALWLDGTTYGAARRDVPVVTGGRWCRSVPGIAWSRESLRRDDVLRLDGLPVVAPVPAALFAARRARDLRDAVVTLDMAASADLVSAFELRLALTSELPRTGIEQARQAVSLMSENSWSPMETRMRLSWVLDARLPTPLDNVPVFDSRGCLVGIPDLLEVRAGLAAEYEGAVHLEADRRRRDVARGRGFAAVELPSLTLVRGDLGSRDGAARLMREAWERAGRRRGARWWTTATPRWWVPSHTVALRRALSAEARARAALPPRPPDTPQRPGSSDD